MRPSVCLCGHGSSRVLLRTLNRPGKGGMGGSPPNPGRFSMSSISVRDRCACLDLDAIRRCYPAGRSLCRGGVCRSDSAHVEPYPIWPACSRRCGCQRFRIASAEQANSVTCPQIGDIIQVATAHRAGTTVCVHAQSQHFRTQPCVNLSNSPVALLRAAGNDLLPDCRGTGRNCIQDGNQQQRSDRVHDHRDGGREFKVAAVGDDPLERRG